MSEKKSIKSYESECLNELYSALSKAQEEMEVAIRNNSNPFYKSRYSDFAAVVKASRIYLTKNNLSVIQRILSNGTNNMYLYTRLCHASGQWIESKMPINPPKSDIQSIGSYITYLRRYTYSAIVGVATSDEDDDGERAMKEEREKSTKTLTPDQLLEVEALLEALPEKEMKNLLKWAQVSDLSLITQEKFEAAKQALQAKIRRNGNGAAK